MAGKGMKRRRQSNVVSRIKRSIKRVEDGHAIRGRADPPKYKGCPYWPITVVLASTGSTDITVASIAKGLFDQVNGVPNTAVGYIRIMTIKSWGLDKTHLNLTIHDPLTDAVIDDLYDWAGDVSFSHLGYSYGRIMSDKPWIFTSTKVVAQVVVPANKRALTYVSVLVRFRSGEPKDRTLGELISGFEHIPSGFTSVSMAE